MKKFLSSGVSECHENHRNDFMTCPFCEHKAESSYWKKQAVMLVLQPKVVRVGCVAIWSECDKCFEKSWVHYTYEHIETDSKWNEFFPKSWANKVDLFAKSLKIQAANSWCKALCGRCKNLHDVDIKYHAWRNCTIGMGPPETECEQFSDKGHQ